jgi:hypothetical protein
MADLGDGHAVGCGGTRRPGAPRPAGTTATFALLTALTLLCGVFVGDWAALTLDVPADSGTARLPWLAGVPSVVALLTAGFVVTEPRRTVRRARLSRVPEAHPATARVARIATECGITTPPELMWAAAEASTGARAFGRPGRYRVKVAPALAGTARRKPAVFDAVMRHELAHIRLRDVLLAYVALGCWYALLVAMALPLVLRVVSPDLSLVPEYLLRVAVLAAVVYAVRARLLREREHYADVQAAAWSAGDEYGRVLDRGRAPAPRPGRRPAWLALHPTPGARRAVVARPAVLARARPGVLAAGGFAAGAGTGLLASLLGAVPDMPATSRTAQAVMAAALGWLGAVELLRWARGTSAGAAAPDASVSRGLLAASAAAVTAGVVAGAWTSLSGTGLLAGTASDPTPWVTGAALGCLLAVAAGPVSGAARAGRTGRVATVAVPAAGALLAGLAADAAFTIGRLVDALGAAAVVRTLPAQLTGTAAAALAALLWVSGVATCARGGRGRPLALGVAGGFGGTLACAVLALRVEPFDGVGVVTRFGTTGAWLVAVPAALVAVATALRRGGAAGLTALGAASLTGGAGLALVLAAGGVLTDPALVARQAATLPLLLALPLLTGAALLAPRAADAGDAAAGVPAGRPVRRLAPGTAVSLAAVVVALAGVALLLPGPVRGAPDPPGRPQAAAYLAEDLPHLLAARNAALVAGEAAMYAPQVSTAADLRSVVVPRYDRALREADDVLELTYVARTPEVRRLHGAFVAVVTAERDYFVAAAAAAENPSMTADAAVREAAAAADRAMADWQDRLAAARSAPLMPDPG